MGSTAQEGGFLTEDRFLRAGCRAALSRYGRLSSSTCHLILHGFFSEVGFSVVVLFSVGVGLPRSIILPSQVVRLRLSRAKVFLIATDRITVVLRLHIHQRGILAQSDPSRALAALLFWVLVVNVLGGL